MFYSQNFLARKGPLGTVWCAAHLQHRLRKSHYTATDIPDIVERIMFPEVPIALRMSSHLLVGVVRIYSKKVDYLYQDCNLVLVTLKNAFVHTDVNLPPNATQAQFNAVTLPETYQLDALDIDDIWPSDAYQENHVHRQEDITLADDIENPNLGGYLAITFDDDIIMEDSSNPEPPNEGLAMMNEGSSEAPILGEGDHDQEPIHTNTSSSEVPILGDQEPIHTTTSPNHPVGDGGAAVANEMNEPDNMMNMDDMEEIEVMRDAVAVADPNPMPMPELLDNQGTGVTSPIVHSEPIIRDKETPILSEENVRGRDPSPPSNPFPGETPDPFQLNPSPRNNSPALELQPTPQAERPQARQKRRRYPIDKGAIVLSNENMKEMLANSSDLVRKRRKCPSSNVTAWRMINKRKKKEGIFFEPSISGLCSDLRNLSEKGFISSNPNLVLPDVEESHQDTTRSEQPSSPIEHLQTEPRDHVDEPLPDPVEQLRDEPQHHHEPSIIADLMPSSPHVASPRVATPPSPHNINSPFSAGTAFHSIGNSIGTGNGSKQATPVRDLELDNYSSVGRSCSPTFMNSADDDELAFLEMDSHSPADSQGTQGSATLSARTRAVAQYLMGQSPSSSSPTVHHRNHRTLTLKTVLHGRSRKMCARMLYETLVLSSYGLVRVEQEEPNEQDEVYGDIKLSLISEASKGQF